MNSKELIKEGKLTEACKQVKEEVKASPADAGKRTLLFQVLAFCGVWDKAESHLDIILSQDPGSKIGVKVYKDLIHAERERGEVFKSNKSPSFMPETPQYMETYNEARKKMRQKKITEAEELFNKIEAQKSAICGTINGKSFSGFKDIDISLSLFLEAIVHERYVWIPFESIRELSISSPKTLFDLLWIPASITTWDGYALSCFLPVIYADSFYQEDDRIRLGRMTDWVPLGGSFSKGIGQHIFQIGEEEIPILEIREVLFKTPDQGKGYENRN